MSRPVAIGLALMAVMTLASVVYLRDVTETVRSRTAPEDEEAAFPGFDEPLFEPTDPRVEIRLFFPAANNDVLIRTRRTSMYASAEPVNQARQIVAQLIAGPDNANLFSPLPAGTQLNQLFITEDGVAYADFNSALADNHPGGILPEQATVYAIVNSLVYNLDGVDRVKILIGGAERETLAGHCLLLLPLSADLSITDIAYQAAADGAATSRAP